MSDPGGYLNTSNPHLLRGFFAYADAANIAATGIKEVALKIKSPQLRACFVGILESSRQRAIQAALDLMVDCG